MTALLIVGSMLVVVAIASSVIAINRRERRRVLEDGRRIATDLGLTHGDRATGERARLAVEVWWSRRASGRGAAPVTICAARFTRRHALGLVIASPRGTSTTRKLATNLHAAARTPAGQRLLPVVSPLVAAAAGGIEGLYNVELDDSGIEILLRDHVFDRARLELALDRCVSLAREVERAVGVA